jgi:hypothetical protein
MALVTLVELHTAHVGALGGLCITHWTRPPLVGELPAMHEAVLRWQQELGHERTALLNVILDDRDARFEFSAAVRAEMAAFYRDDTAFRRGVVHVFELQGLIGSAVRSVLNTVFLLARPANPVQSVATVEAALPWLRRWHGDGGWDEAAVLAAELQGRRLTLALRDRASANPPR